MTAFSDPTSTVDRLGIARSTLEWHLSHPVEKYLVEKRYDRRRAVIHLVDTERTAGLLSRVTSSAPDRLVYRFLRLVDLLLEDAEGSTTGG